MYTVSIVCLHVVRLRVPPDGIFKHAEMTVQAFPRIKHQERRIAMTATNQKPIIITVSQTGNADHRTVAEALHALEEADRAGVSISPALIRIGRGTYRERITIRRPFLTLEGEDAADTVLTFGLYARMPSEDIGKLGTFRSYSCLIDTHDFTARNLTFANSSGKGSDVGQALAVYADGDRLVFDRCRFLGGQDTLFTAPLPPKEIEPNGFIGPKQHEPRQNGRHYYKNCYIEGDIDFIFGGATAYFESCELHSKDNGQEINSFVTAASTPKDQAYGYVMQDCRFTGSCPPASAYLGRPWREYAKTVLLNCYIGEHIREEGWHDWNKPQARETVLYAEYNSFGPSSDYGKRPGWVKELTAAEAQHYKKSKVLGGDDRWDP